MPSALINASLTSGQVLRLDLLHRDQEVGLLAGDVLAAVVGRELQRKWLRLSDLHAAHGFVELLEHLALADDEREGFGLAAGKTFAVDLAFEVDRHAVAVGRAFAGRPLRIRAPLLAQDVDRAGRLPHRRRHSATRSTSTVAMSPSLTSGYTSNVASNGARCLRARPPLGVMRRHAGHAQLGLVGGVLERCADLVVHRPRIAPTQP